MIGTGLGPEERAALYRDAIARTTPRLLGMLDRGPESATHGSFDRDHWAWKMRDFPIGMPQMALVPLAKMVAMAPRLGFGGAEERVRDWIAGGVRETLRRQHANGSYDSVGPFTQDHGMTMAAAWILSTVGHRLADDLPSDLLDAMRRAARAACAFGLRSEEDYAFISNHQALFALAFHETGRFVDDAALSAHADALVHEIVERQSPDGWYREYDGPDPGYETLGVHYLAELLDERAPTGLRESLARSVRHLSHFVHADGGLGGVYGSRHTRLFVPGGLERLARWLPEAEAIVARVTGHVPETRVVTLDSVDHHNLPPLLGGYVSAFEAASAPRTGGVEDVELPVDRESMEVHFEDSGVTVVIRPSYYAVLSGRAGGVGVVQSRPEGRTLLRDAGYLAEADGRRWTSQALGSSEARFDHDGHEPTLSVEGRFAAAKEQVVTPWNHLVLRILNLTLFRSVRLGAWVRGQIVRRMITGSEEGGLRLHRDVRFGTDSIEFLDRVSNEGGPVATNLRRADAFLGIHMGSARYFTMDELEGPGPEAPPDGTGRVRPGETLEWSRTIRDGGTAER